jgi:hypothetical protein
MDRIRDFARKAAGVTMEVLFASVPVANLQVAMHWDAGCDVDLHHRDDGRNATTMFQIGHHASP